MLLNHRFCFLLQYVDLKRQRAKGTQLVMCVHMRVNNSLAKPSKVTENGGYERDHSPRAFT